MEAEKYNNFLVKKQGIITSEQAMKNIKMEELRRKDQVSELLANSGKIVELPLATESIVKISQSYNIDKKNDGRNAQSKLQKKNTDIKNTNSQLKNHNLVSKQFELKKAEQSTWIMDETERDK